MLLDIIMGVLLSWQTFVAPEPSVPQYPPDDIRNNRSDWIKELLGNARNTPRRNRSDLSTRVHKHPQCPQVTRHTFKTSDPNNPWVWLLSQYCERKPPEIHQPVMGTFGIYPRNCIICCVTRGTNSFPYTVKAAWTRQPCSHRMRCDGSGHCVNADLNDLPKQLPAPFAKMVDFTLENMWTG
uniref:Secreted protein n=1 Tax=Ixodes ricinus TaxID=34613 RepID=A0A147BUZ8_IXORI